MNRHVRKSNYIYVRNYKDADVHSARVLGDKRLLRRMFSVGPPKRSARQKADEKKTFDTRYVT